MPTIGVLVLLFLLMATPAVAAPETRRYTGHAYERGSDRLVYTEVHEEHWEKGRELGGTTTYFDPQGKQIGIKTADYRDDYYLPRFQLDLPALDYSEGITGNRVEVVMVRKNKRLGERKQTVRKAPVMAADSGFLHFIEDNFPALLAHKTVKLKLAVASRLDTVSVRLRRVADSQFEGRTSVNVQVEHDSPLSLLLQPLVLGYDAESRRLLEYKGTSNILDPATGDPYDVRIAFFSRTPPQK